MSHLYSTAYIDAQYQEGQYCGDEGPAYPAFGSAHYPTVQGMAEEFDFLAFVFGMEGDFEQADEMEAAATRLWAELED